MYPDLFGIEGFSMTLMILIGAIAALAEVLFFLKSRKKVKTNYVDLLITMVFTVLIGIVGTIIFENIYEAIKHAVYHEPQVWTWGMTFYGGLIFGVVAFLLLYRFFYLRHNEPILKEMLKIAPASISLGHAFGRIGCLLSGCCYGKDTDAWYGIMLPGHEHPTIPTQVIEMIFLFILATILAILAFKQITNYTFPIYMVSYGVFRFIIEFFRGDERGQLAGLSPSQYICIALVIGAGVLFYFYKTKIFAEVKQDDVKA